MADAKFGRSYFESRYEKAVAGFSAEARRAYLYKARLRALARVQVKPRAVLEIGCGTGQMTRWLERLPDAPLIVALDVSRDGLTFAKTRINGTQTFLIQTDGVALPLPSEWADLVVSFDVIEHVADPESMLREIARVLRPGGVLMYSTPNPHSLGARIKKPYPEWRGRPIEQRKWQWFGHRDDSHISIRPIEAWRNAVRALGFEILADGTDYWWDAPYVPWIPALLQELVCKLTHRALTRISYFAPWRLGENYIAICQKLQALREQAD